MLTLISQEPRVCRDSAVTQSVCRTLTGDGSPALALILFSVLKTRPIFSAVPQRRPFENPVI